AEESAEESAAELAPEPEEPKPIDLDDLSRSLVETPVEVKPEKKVKKEKPTVIIARPDREEKKEVPEKRKKRKGKQLIYSEEMGEVVVKRKRKGSRRRPDWEEFDIEDF
ncbi:MAG: hypothetical protein ACE5E7_15575, partial [Anaerolineae bacterium]